MRRLRLDLRGAPLVTAHDTNALGRLLGSCPSLRDLVVVLWDTRLGNAALRDVFGPMGAAGHSHMRRFYLDLGCNPTTDVCTALPHCPLPLCATFTVGFQGMTSGRRAPQRPLSV